MNLKKILPLIFLILCLSLCVSIVNADDSGDDTSSYQIGESGEFKIDYTYPMPVEDFVDLIKNFPEMYSNNESVEWMENLDNHVVFYCGNDYVIMDKSESEIIYDFDKEEALVGENTPIRCDILEIHVLTSDLYNETAYLVENVELESENSKSSQPTEEPETSEDDYSIEDGEFKINDYEPDPVSEKLEDLNDYYDRHYGDDNNGNVISDTVDWIFGDDEQDYEDYEEQEELLDTTNWLTDYEDYVSISTEDGDYLIMNKSEAENLPEPDDNVKYNIVKCDVIKTKTADYSDYILVKNVELIGQEKVENETEPESDNDASSDTSSSSESSSSYSDTSSYGSYIGNSNTGKFHHASCGDVSKMSPKNKVSLSSREEAISRGFSPCGHCHP